MHKFLIRILVISIFCCSQFIIAQETTQEKPEESAEELAKKLANPISSLISLPFQNNTDLGIGPNNGSRNTLNIQPVIPISLNENLSLITRMILPFTTQYDVTGLGNTETGLGDAVLSAFLSPSKSKGGLTWGAGPVFLVPTATDDFLGAKKFGVGPTAVALYQTNGVTFGALINQIWSIAGNKDFGDVSTLYFQPFLTYNWKSGAGIGASFDITQNWEADTTTIWFNPTISGITSLGSQKVQFAVGPRFNLAAPSATKADIGFRAVIAFLFPK